METIPLHPAIVHFPIAIFVIIGLLGIISIFTETVFLKKTIFWLYILGILSALAAIISGLLAEESLVHNEAIHELLEKHETNAFIISGFFLILFVWYWIRKKIERKVEYIIWVLLIIVGTGFLAYQNYLGGEMVYGHGAAVKPMESIIKQEAGQGHSHSDD